MKIFNWVHRRFIPKDGLGQNVKKDEEILTSYADTEALLENVVPADILRLHGILSIGTFGVDPILKEISNIEHEYFGSFKGKDDLEEEESEDEYSHVEDDDDEEDDNSYDEEEWNPLVYDKSGAPRPTAIIMTINAKPSPDFEIHPDCQDYSYSDDYMNNKKKQRITLADLFSAESDGNSRPNYRNAPPPSHCSNKSTTPTTTPGATPDHAEKNGKLFAKKIIPRVKQDSRPIQKLHGLMKRMLKKKIHPDVVEGKIKPCAAVIPSGKFGISESVSLLQTQDEATSEL